RGKRARIVAQHGTWVAMGAETKSLGVSPRAPTLVDAKNRQHAVWTLGRKPVREVDDLPVEARNLRNRGIARCIFAVRVFVPASTREVRVSPRLHVTATGFRRTRPLRRALHHGWPTGECVQQLTEVR